MTNAMRRVCICWIATGMCILATACGRSGTDLPPDTTPPTAPTDVKAVATSPNDITLSWVMASDNVRVTKYEIYVGGVYLESMESTTTVYIYSGLTPSTEYCCTVRAIDAAGNESAVSDPPACATTSPIADTTAPAVPTGLIGAASQIKIALSWNPSAHASTYNVYQDGVLVGTSTDASYIDTGLTATTPHCYTVTAVDAAGNESAKCAPVCITTLAPPLDVSFPTVTSTFPLSGATDVQIDPFVATATFSEAMNMISVTGPGSFALTNTTGSVTGNVAYDAGTNTVKFTPLNPLVPGEVYTAVISRNVEDVAGNFMGVDYIWSFTTTTTPNVTLPIVISTSPANNEFNVAVNKDIQAVFSEVMNGDTIMAPFNFTCATNPGGNISGLISYNLSTLTASFAPSVPLAHAAIYECRISKNVTDLLGHGMVSSYVWRFATAP